MKWKIDLIEDIRFNSALDDADGGVFPHPLGYDGSRGEFTLENRNLLKEYFMHVKDQCTAILEIGVCRNNQDSSTHVFLENKNPETVYIGIDLDDKTFLNDPAKNIHTIQGTSSDVEKNMELIKSLGVTEFDFIFIDGWHSVNQVLIDWEYTRWLSSSGIVGFHDTSAHPGPVKFVRALNREIWNVEENVSPEDHGIGFAWLK
jgi:hypothetical protein